jgi:hypothetical protein
VGDFLRISRLQFVLILSHTLLLVHLNYMVECRPYVVNTCITATDILPAHQGNLLIVLVQIANKWDLKQKQKTKVHQKAKGNR